MVQIICTSGPLNKKHLEQTMEYRFIVPAYYWSSKRPDLCPIGLIKSNGYSNDPDIMIIAFSLKREKYGKARKTSYFFSGYNDLICDFFSDTNGRQPDDFLISYGEFSNMFNRRKTFIVSVYEVI